MFSKLKFYFSILWYYILQNAKVKFTYRANFYFSFLATFAYVFVNLSFIWVIFQQVPFLRNWKFEEVVFLLGIGELTFGIFSTFFGQIAMNLPGNYILDGQLDRPLLRPINTLVQLVIENFNFNEVIIILKGLALIVYSSIVLNFSFGIWKIFLLLSLSVCGAMIYSGIFLFFSSLSFWFRDRRGFTDPLYVLNNYSRWPLEIFPKGIKLFFTWLIPFGFVAFYPATLVLEKDNFGNVAFFTPLVAIFFFGISILTFLKGLKKYESSGT
ncbi:ABC-2 family transporter protein [bacterium]|nr:ABC-2 family transporter protein [bacterium]